MTLIFNKYCKNQKKNEKNIKRDLNLRFPVKKYSMYFLSGIYANIFFYFLNIKILVENIILVVEKQNID